MKFSDQVVNNAIERAVFEVFKTMVNKRVEVITESPNVTKETPVIASHILIRNENSMGICQVAVERSLAVKIAESMTGMKFDAYDKIIDDTVGELINMFIGFAKSQLANTENRFEIVPPFIITGNGLQFQEKVGQNVYKKYFSVEGDIFALQVLYA